MKIEEIEDRVKKMRERQGASDMGDEKTAKETLKTIAAVIVAVLAIILIIAVPHALGWLMTCGMLKLISLCFGLPFNWMVTTGIWFVLCLLK